MSKCIFNKLNKEEFRVVSKQNAIIPQNGIIYWHLKKPTTDVSVDEQIKVLEKTFEYWAEAFAPIKFERTDNEKIAPIKIHFATNRDRDIPSRFESGVLGYAYFPRRDSLGIHSDIYFNDLYQWEEMHSPGRVSLLYVGVHELGHSFGIHHNTVEGGIMNATYDPSVPLKITQDSINAVNFLYGQYKGNTVDVPVEPETPKPTQTFQKGAKRPIEYPVRNLTGVEGVVSPRIGNAYSVERPTFPGEKGFKEELDEVVRVQLEASKGIWSDWFFEKYGLPSEPTEILTAAGVVYGEPDTASHIVHMDKPVDLYEFVLDYLLQNKAKLKEEPKGTINFLERIPRTLAIASKNVYEALEKAFEVKYYFGRPRPEEVMNCPPNIATMYPEGCPGHPSYPAGHGAASSAIYKTVKEEWIVSNDVLKIIEITTKQFAMYRTIAGVHYANDNIVGWELGAGEKW